MARSKNNIITHGLSGKVGNLLVFSQRGDGTFVSKAPKARTGEYSEKQKAQHQRFQQATLYAKVVYQDPVTKKLYEEAAKNKEMTSAYNVAVADLLNAPKIEEINLSQYTGKVGDTISVIVTDDFKVVSVKIAIYNADGSLVEEGQATQKGLVWIYKATKANTQLEGDKIVIQATDLPANLSEKNQNL